MSARIAAYVQKSYAKQTYARESYDTRAWPGFELVIHALRAAGHEVDYCTAASVTDHDIILVSLTASCDWWSFIAERVRWKPGRYKVIVGGAGLLNVRPFLEYADVFVFGRGKDIIDELVRETLAGHRLEDPAVCYADDFNPDRVYEMRQAQAPYPHEITLANGKKYREAAVGCQRRCLFCGYTWQRRNIGGNQTDASAGKALWTGSEFTASELYNMIRETDGELPMTVIVGLDGFSERIRRAVNKPITNEMIRTILDASLADRFKGGIPRRWYNIVGFPTEAGVDVTDFVDICRAADRAAQATAKYQKVVVSMHLTPFQPMPVTPLATWPVADRDFRDSFYFGTYETKGPTGSVCIYTGRRLLVLIEKTTEALSTITEAMLAFRAVESDAPEIKRIACSRKYWGARSAVRMATLRDQFDVGRIFGRYTWDDLPTRYLLGWATREQFQRADAVAWKRLHGEERQGTA